MSKGWFSPRSLWLNCLTCGNVIATILQFDPRGIHGLYHITGLKFLEWMTVLGVLQSLTFTAYMYLIVLYKYNMTRVPIQVRNVWIIINTSFMFTHIVLSAIGSLTENLFVYGVDSLVLLVHGDLIVVVLNVSICRLRQALGGQTQELSTSGCKSDFSVAIKKLSYVCIISLIIAVLFSVYTLAAPGAVDRLKSSYILMPSYENSAFSVSTIWSPFTVSAVYTLLLYSARRPQSKSSNGKTYTPHAKEVSVSSSIQIKTPSLSASTECSSPPSVVCPKV